MYIPFIYCIDNESGSSHMLWVFYRYLSMCKEYNWPIFAQEEYFIDPIEYEKDKRVELTEQDYYVHEYVKPTKEDIDFIIKVSIPRYLEMNLIKKMESAYEAALYILKSDWKEMEGFIEEKLIEISNNSKEELKGLITWIHYPFLENVCNKLGIKLIEMELSPIRKLEYNENLAYFQFEDKFKSEEHDLRWEKFKLENKNPTINILTRKEILALFLNKGELYELNEIDDYEEFDMGVALNTNNHLISIAKNDFDNDEMLNEVSKILSSEKVLIRHRLSNENTKDYNFKNIDQSITSGKFIKKCRRIVSVNSNVSVEAMIYGKTSYVLGSLSIKNMAIGKMDNLEEAVVSLEYLNFLIFNYFAPYSLMFTKDYIDFRMGNPSETEINKKHMDFYFKKRNIDNKLFELNGTNRYEFLLNSIGVENVSGFLESKKGDNVRSLIEQIQNTSKEHSKCIKTNLELSKDIERLNKELNALYNSKSWKVTKIFRRNPKGGE